MRELEDAQVAVVGLGLMGGSLAGALRGQCRSVVGVARRTEAIETGIARGLIDRGTTDLQDGVRRADVVVLATPVRTILSLLDEVGPLLPPGCLLTDLGSTKAEVVAKMSGLPGHVEPLGAHPMCGREISGIGAADSALYQGQVFILTPLLRTSKAALALGRDLVQAVGGVPLTLDPQHHDRLVAVASHLPYLIACALVATAEQAAKRDPVLWDVAASGFRDTSRLSASSVTMMLDILLTNKEAVLEMIAAYDMQMHTLARLLEAQAEEELRAGLMAVCNRRRALFA